METTGVDYDEAARIMEDAKGSVKAAIVMKKLGVDLDEANSRLDAAAGFVRRALAPGDGE